MVIDNEMGKNAAESQRRIERKQKGRRFKIEIRYEKSPRSSLNAKQINQVVD